MEYRIYIIDIFLEFAQNESVLKELDEDWESIAPHLLQYYFTLPKEEHASVARKIRKHYFGEKPINRENVQILIHLVSDRLFAADAAKAAIAQAKANQSPVWFHFYTYRAQTSLSESFTVPRTKDNFGKFPCF